MEGLLRLAYVAETMLVVNLAYMALVPYRYKHRVRRTVFKTRQELSRTVETQPDAEIKHRMKTHPAWQRLNGLIAETYIPERLRGSWRPKTAWLRESWGGGLKCIFYRFHLGQGDLLVCTALAVLAGLLLFSITYFDMACVQAAEHHRFGCGGPRLALVSVLDECPLCFFGSIAIGCILPIVFINRGRAACNRAKSIAGSVYQDIVRLPLGTAEEKVEALIARGDLLADDDDEDPFS